MVHEFLPDEVARNRIRLAKESLKGAGIEVGALHNPLSVPRRVRVRYVDRLGTEALREHYPELDGCLVVKPDIIDDGETLGKVGDSSQDFVIANHFIEHCENPINATKNFLRALRPGGVLFMAIPDKTGTFDNERPITPFSHLIKDYEQGPAWSRRDHYMEWTHLVEHVPVGMPQVEHAERLMAKSYSIHFHVWDHFAMMNFVYNLKQTVGLQFEIRCFLRNAGYEGIFILVKSAAPHEQR
jgi:SAM-dependent methyltransferase